MGGGGGDCGESCDFCGKLLEWLIMDVFDWSDCFDLCFLGFGIIVVVVVSLVFLREISCVWLCNCGWLGCWLFWLSFSLLDWDAGDNGGSDGEYNK